MAKSYSHWKISVFKFLFPVTLLHSFHSSLSCERAESDKIYSLVVLIMKKKDV